MEALRGFFEGIRGDHRVGTAHVSLYAALVGLCSENDCSSFIPICREEVMARSRILGKTTYYTCLHDLAEWGWIEYRPEQSRRRRSGVRVLGTRPALIRTDLSE
jgi:hypothetical protein